MATADDKHIIEAVRAALMVVHSAAGLTLSSTSRDATRMMRAAEGLCRAAVAVLQQPSTPSTASPEVRPPRRRRPRARKKKTEIDEPMDTKDAATEQKENPKETAAERLLQALRLPADDEEMDERALTDLTVGDAGILHKAATLVQAPNSPPEDRGAVHPCDPAGLLRREAALTQRRTAEEDTGPATPPPEGLEWFAHDPRFAAAVNRIMVQRGCTLGQAQIVALNAATSGQAGALRDATTTRGEPPSVASERLRPAQPYGVIVAPLRACRPD